MNKLALKSLSLLLAANLTASKKISPSNDIYQHDLTLVEWYLYGMRGLWYGTYRGLYHEKKKTDSRCLSDSVSDEVVQIMTFFAYGELADIFTLADSISTLYYDNY
jgi:hypothetical protein